MIVESSAPLAVALDEPDARRFADAMTAAPRPRISAANWYEVVMVVDRRGDAEARRRLDALVLQLVPFTAAHAAHAREASRNSSRGRRGAKLNVGDCLACGGAKGERETLLFKGRAFGRTDIEPAMKDG
jgi:ribonuclease VapC